MLIVLISGIIWVISYLFLASFAQSDTIIAFFICGAASIPALFGLDILVSWCLGMIAPPNYDKITGRRNMINLINIVIFTVIFYHIVAKGTSAPFLILATGILVFALDLSQNIANVMTRNIAPDYYNAFIIAKGTIWDRIINGSIAFALQFFWVKLLS